MTESYKYHKKIKFFHSTPPLHFIFFFSLSQTYITKTFDNKSCQKQDKMTIPKTSSLVFFLAFVSLNLTFSTASSSSYNVVNFGAKTDGKSNSIQAFQSAWNKACCSNKPASIYVPRGRYYIGNATLFNGPCKNNAIFIRIDGTLVAPLDFRVIGNSQAWIMFRHVDGVTISGGVLDGQGIGLWACKNSTTNSCPRGASVCEFFLSI